MQRHVWLLKKVERYLRCKQLPAQPVRTIDRRGFVAMRAACATVLIAMAQSRPSLAQSIPIAPPATTVEYTVYALGLVPIHTTFQEFAGRVVVDGKVPGGCRIDVVIDIASLHMADPTRQRTALSASMLDATRYPTMHFSGRCVPAAITGILTLHGVSRPLTLSMAEAHGQLLCSGTIRRGDFGVNGLPGLVGARVRMRLTTPMPAKLQIARGG